MGIFRHKRSTFFLVAIVLILGVSSLVVLGYYPIALVGTDFVSAREFWKDYRAASVSYDRLSQAYGSLFQQKPGSPEEIQAQVLQALIEEGLIRQEMYRMVGPNADSIVESKIQRFTNDKKLSQAAQTLYNLSFNDFRDAILIPEAEKEILSGRLFLDGKNFDDWLSAAKKSARVVIFSQGFRWTRGKVEPE